MPGRENEALSGPVDRALAYVGRQCLIHEQPAYRPVTLNFHPDTCIDGASMIDLLARDGVYRSQFETGTSNGGRTAYPGGERWDWESRIFGKAYDEAEVALRPKYGALNYRFSQVGGSPRFGSCHLRLYRHTLARTTFCYPDSHLGPQDFGIEGAGLLIALAAANQLGLDPVLDNYVEAHVHGVLRVHEDVEAVVLDPSYRDTAIEAAARRLGCGVEWHDGYRLHLDHLQDCARYRGPIAAEAITRIAVQDGVTLAALGAARDHMLDYKVAKLVWHCVARYGWARH
jgi:hypothetical protein